MATTFVQDAFPVVAIGPIGTSINLLTLLQQAYGAEVGRITSIKIGYFDAAYLASINNSDGTDNPFLYWDSAVTRLTTVQNNGVDIGGGGSTGSPIPLPTINNADFSKITIKVGNNIMPNVVIQIQWDKTVDNDSWQTLHLATLPTAPPNAFQPLLTHPFDGNTRPLDIVNAARSIAILAGGVPNGNDCHWIAMQIAAAAGAALDWNTQMIVAGSSPVMQAPNLNEDGGFWRVAYRGSQANPVDNWQTLVQPGDIVRMGWTGGGFHTLTVMAGLNADGAHPGQILVVDNTGPAVGGVATIAEHWVDYDGTVTDEKQVTIYRLTTDHQYVIRGTEKNDDMVGTVLNDAISAGLGNDVVHSGLGDDVINGGDGADTLYGGGGNDLYQLLTTTAGKYDTVVEGANQGTDTIWVKFWDPAVKSYALGANIENGVINDPNVSGFTLTGNGLANKLFDDVNSNTLDGAGGNDTLNGGAGLDALIGGDGNDTYELDDRSFGIYDDVREASATGGTDSVYLTPIYDATMTKFYQLTTNVENLVLRGSAAFDMFGNGGNNVMFGNTGANTIWGLAGNDILNGGTGLDTLNGGTGNDQYFLQDFPGTGWDVVNEDLDGGDDTVWISTNFTDVLHSKIYALGANIENGYIDTAAPLTLLGNALNNVLVGNSGSDTLVGGEGHDLLDGGTGADLMAGNEGSDTYVRDNAGDVIGEANTPGAGDADLVLASVSTTLSANVENLTLTGGSNISGVGNEIANQISGNSANNFLNGGDGADTLAGSLGDDVYQLFSLTAGKYDTVIETAGQGTDTVWVKMADATVKTYTLGANIENGVINDPSASGFTLTGNELNNKLFDDINSNTLDGAGGNDTLNGGNGLDTLIGGLGDDTYELNDRSLGFYDDVRETSAAGGTDTVYVAPIYDAFQTRYYQLTSNVENGVINGSANFDLYGNTGNNSLTGNAGANALYGFAGNDSLTGGSGLDTLAGGAGDDQYFLQDLINNAFDVVVEDAVPGIDTVWINSNLRNASVTSYALGANVENGIIDGTTSFSLLGNSLNNSLRGNSGNDTLNGFSGNDRLDGGLGADSMFGGLGSDTYVRDNAGDYIFEVSNPGADNVDLVLASVSTSLTNFVENLTLTGTSAIYGVGNTLGNQITGNTADNALNGSLGNDTLTGGLGNDTFAFSTALSAAANVDLITDFANAQGNNDTIRLLSTVFTALKTASPHYLTTAEFVAGAGAAAATSTQRMLYDTATGWLSYDADGNGAGAAIHFATIGNKATLTAGDFLVT